MNKYLKYTTQFLITNKRILIAGFLLLAVAFILQNKFTSSETTDVETASLKTVSTASAQSLTNKSDLRLLGTVAPAEEAYVTSEISGRVETIQVKEGDDVAAGTVLATINNTEQRIAVTQAETSLRSARANAAQSDIGLEDAKTKTEQAKQILVNSLQSTYATAQRILQENIDPNYSNPRYGVIGAKVGKGVMVQILNEKREKLREVMPKWEERIAQASNLSDAELENLVTSSQTNISEIISLVDNFIFAFQNEDANTAYSDDTLQNLYVTFTKKKEELLNTKNTLSANRTNLENARNALNKAEISSTSGTYAAGNTQIDQARASLASAQNRLAQTIFRAPIAGTVQNFSITLGEYLTPGTKLATIANETAQEITTYINTTEQNQIKVGTKVLVNDIYEGTVTRIAPSVEVGSGKLPVKIITSDTDLTSGETVEVTILNENETDIQVEEDPSSIYVPLTAILFDASGSNVLTVSENNVLQAIPVTLGSTQGSTIEITSGITKDQEIVIDVRGKKIGETVTVQNTK